MTTNVQSYSGNVIKAGRVDSRGIEGGNVVNEKRIIVLSCVIKEEWSAYGNMGWWYGDVNSFLFDVSASLHWTVRFSSSHFPAFLCLVIILAINWSLCRAVFLFGRADHATWPDESLITPLLQLQKERVTASRSFYFVTSHGENLFVHISGPMLDICRLLFLPVMSCFKVCVREWSTSSPFCSTNLGVRLHKYSLIGSVFLRHASLCDV